MNKILWTAILFGILLLGACGEEDDSAGAGMNVHPIETVFNSSGTADPGESVTLSVTVTHGDDVVEDADEVIYEIWQSGFREDGEKLPAEHVGEGVYEAETIFDEEGLYFVQAHTTARRLHRMPTQELIVGNSDPDTIVPDESDDSDSNVDMGGHGH